MDRVKRQASDFGKKATTMKTMTHAEHLSKFEEQQRGLAERAKSAEITEFHTELANHYAKLVAEIRTLSAP